MKEEINHFRRHELFVWFWISKLNNQEMDRNTIIEILKAYKRKSEFCDKIKELGMFGSYATGENSVHSDIDIFIKLEPAKMFDLISIKSDLEKLLGNKVDIIAIRNSMNEYLKKQIKQNGIYV